MPGDAKYHDVVAAFSQVLPDRAQRVWSVREPVHQERTTDRLDARLEDLRAVPVRTEPRGMRASFTVVAIGRKFPRRFQLVLDPFANGPERVFLNRQQVGERGRLCERSCGGVWWNDAVPRLEVGETPPGVQRPSDDNGCEDQRDRPEEAKGPSPKERAERRCRCHSQFQSRPQRPTFPCPRGAIPASSFP